MSTELSNGVIIPEEYSDDWYDEMSINLRKLNDVITAASDNATDIQRLDTDKANQSDLTALTSRVSQNETDIIALQTAVSGALKREIVQTLPTEDISTTTIYMIRNSQSSGTNIYDEYMYINNLWELIGTSATDFSNYYTKNETDNLLSAKANQTDLTSLSGRVTQNETDITALQTAVSGALKREIVQSLPTQDISTTTIYMIRNTTTSGDNIYDEYMYINNLWELIGTSATDFSNYYTKTEIDTLLSYKATDSDVVHKSGNETVGGVKTFSDDITLQGTTTPVIKTISNIVQDTSAYNGSVSWVVRDKDNLNNILESALYKYSAKSIDWQLKLTGIDNGVSNTKGIRFTLNPVNNVANFIPIGNNNTSLGNSSTKWEGVYATNYYYGSNNVEFSTKFVTTDTAQTISGVKTFSEDIVIKNRDTSQTTKRLVITSSKVNLGDGNSDSWGISFNAGSSYVATINSEKSINSAQGLNFSVRTKDGNNNLISTSYRLRVYTDGSAYLIPSTTDYISLGSSANRWKDVQTNLVNGLTPSSLSLPATTGTVDISSYITDLTGTANTYTVLANGYIQFDVTGSSVEIDVTNGLSQKWIMTDPKGFIPVVSGASVSIKVVGTAINNFKFIPCQANI